LIALASSKEKLLVIDERTALDSELNSGTSEICEFIEMACNHRTSTKTLYLINPNSLKIDLSGPVLSP